MLETVQVVTAAVGLNECNSRLAEGWRIIWSSITAEERSGGRADRQRTWKWQPLFLLGRSLSNETEMERALASEQATAEGEDALDANPAVPDEPEGRDGDGDETVAALPVQPASDGPAPKPPVGSRRSRPKKRSKRPSGPASTTTIKKGEGAFEGHGIRGG